MVSGKENLRGKKADPSIKEKRGKGKHVRMGWWERVVGNGASTSTSSNSRQVPEAPLAAMLEGRGLGLQQGWLPRATRKKLWIHKKRPKQANWSYSWQMIGVSQRETPFHLKDSSQVYVYKSETSNFILNIRKAHLPWLMFQSTLLFNWSSTCEI